MIRAGADAGDIGTSARPFSMPPKEDHIVPWQTAYASTQLLGGDSTFVLGASGHIAGVINPPAKKKRNYWTLAGTEAPTRTAGSRPRITSPAAGGPPGSTGSSRTAGGWWPPARSQATPSSRRSSRLPVATSKSRPP
jgi:hypothetical protein